MDAIEYKQQWQFAKDKAKMLMIEFGLDTSDSMEVNIIAMSFMEGFAYALLYTEEEKQKSKKQ